MLSLESYLRHPCPVERFCLASKGVSRVRRSLAHLVKIITKKIMKR